MDEDSVLRIWATTVMAGVTGAMVRYVDGGGNEVYVFTPDAGQDRSHIKEKAPCSNVS